MLLLYSCYIRIIRSFFIQSFIIHSFNLLLLLFSLISFDSLRFNYQNLRESRRVDEGRIVGESFEDYNIHRWRAGKKGKVGKEKRVEEWKAKKICAAKEISGTNRGGAMRATLFLRLIALSFSPSFSSSAFSQAHVHPATHTQTREEDTRKRSHTTVRSSSLSLSFFHQPIVLKNRARRFAYNNVHCIFEQWEDPPSSSPFPPSLPPYRCLFQRQDQASRALINGGKRSSSFDP